MRSQVRGGDNDKLCFSVVSDRNGEMEKRERRIEKQGRDLCGCVVLVFVQRNHRPEQKSLLFFFQLNSTIFLQK